MSLLLSSFLSWFPARWSSCHFHCTGCPSPSASTAWAFTELDFCCAWCLPHWGQAEVVSARLNLRHSTRYVLGVCNFLGSVSLEQRFDMVGQCYSLVTAQSFIPQAKESTPLRCEGGPTPKERSQSVLASSVYMFVSSLLSLPYVNWASLEGCLFYLRFSLTLVLWFSFVPFSWFFFFFFPLFVF